MPIRRITTAAFLLIAAASLSSFAFAEQNDTRADSADSDALSLRTLSGLFSKRITKLKLEIRNESERRTTILGQLDQVINEISALENKSQNTFEKAPSPTESLQTINTEIVSLEDDVRHNESLLKQLKYTLDHQPELSVWQAALGSPKVQKRRQLRATQSYLIYITEKYQRQLENKRTLLDKRYQSFVEYEENVERSIGEIKNHVDKLIERRKHLEHQLTVISAQIVDRQDNISALTESSAQAVSNPAALYFGNLENKLKDPVEGRVIKEFSDSKAKGLLKWKGILIEAPLGLPFTSVSNGRVVFADELQGLGKVAIVDHGHGYMTLYGMAELLLVEKDQYLLAGDPVGTIGESVGADASALYFEVRHNADALDPQNWLKMQQIKRKNTR